MTFGCTILDFTQGIAQCNFTTCICNLNTRCNWMFSYFVTETSELQFFQAKWYDNSTLSWLTLRIFTTAFWLLLFELSVFYHLYLWYLHLGYQVYGIAQCKTRRTLFVRSEPTRRSICIGFICRICIWFIHLWCLHLGYQVYGCDSSTQGLKRLGGRCSVGRLVGADQKPTSAHAVAR